MPFKVRKAIYAIVMLICILFSGNMFPRAANAKELPPVNPKISQLLQRGDSLLSKDLTEKALACFQTALKQSVIERDSTGRLLAISSIARVDMKRSEWDTAINELYKAKILAEKLHPDTSRLYIRILFNLGRSYHEAGIEGNRNSLDSALHYYNTALRLRMKTNYPNRKELAENYYRLGSLYYYDLTDYAQSEENLLKAWEIYKQENDTLDVNLGRVNYILASLNRTIGDLERSISYAREANRIFSHPKVDKPLNALYSRIVLANTYYDENQYQQAIRWYRSVIERAIEYFGSNAPQLVNFCNNYAAALIATDEPEKAREQLKKAIEINRNNPPPDYENLAFSYLHLADCAEKSHQPEEELHYLKLCLATREQHLPGNRHQIYQGIRFIGEYYERMNDFDTALQYYQQALQVLFPEFRNVEVSSNPEFKGENREDVFYILYDKARTFLKRYDRDKNPADLQNAYTLYLTGDRLIDEARNSNFFEESKLLFNELFKKDLDAGIMCAYRYYKLTNDKMYIESLFRLIEKSKYMLLLHSLIQTRQKSALGIPDSLKTREQKLNQKINMLKHQIASISSDNPDDNRKEKWNHQLLTAINARDRIKKNLETLYPDYYDLKYDSTFITLRVAQKRLKGTHQQVLEYYWGDTAAIILSIFPDTVFVKDIRLTGKLSKLLTGFTSSLTGSVIQNTPSKNFRSYVSAAFFLYQTLIRPELLKIKTPDNSQLIIIPDGPLALIPFEAFLTAPVETGFIDYSRLPYFVKSKVISYGYSLNLMFRKQMKKSSLSKLHILAMSYSGPQTTRSEHNRREQSREIPWSEKELRSINRYIKNGTYLSGTNATESRFKTLAPQSKVIHLAVHGIADEKNDLNTRLEFKPEDDKTNDGKLYNYELYGLNLRNTQLAVLSACETGIGKQYAGEGIYSIARAFYYAGCPTIVMSLWKVNDQFTAKLMGFFYKGLSKNKSVNVALHDAKCTFLEKAGEMEGHPSNWASFIVIGKTSKVSADSKIFLYLILTAILIIAASAFVYFHRIRK